jgi:hypothetical protein
MLSYHSSSLNLEGFRGIFVTNIILATVDKMAFPKKRRSDFDELEETGVEEELFFYDGS